MHTRAVLHLVAVVSSILVAEEAIAQRRTLAIVVKGLDNGFFTVMGKGCADWNAANPDSEYECLYTGPALTSDEAAEVQIFADLIARDDVAGIAISPSNAPAMAKLLTEKAADIEARRIAIMTIDTDLLPADQGLRKTYFGSDNYAMGYRLGEYAKMREPNGGKVCTVVGNPQAENILQRAQGTRDALAGQQGLSALSGEGGWTEVAGCPIFDNSDGTTGVQVVDNILEANPDLDALVLDSGLPRGAAVEDFRQLMRKRMDRIASGDFVVAAADIWGADLDFLREGLVSVLIGQRPYQMGREAPDIIIKIINGETVEDPVYTGLDECTRDNIDVCVSG